MELKPNALLNSRYRLIEEKGRGAFGEVWLARDEQLDLDVAIKIYIALDDRGMDDFRTEYRTSWTLNHPNLLHAFHFDMDGRHPYLVMPYCPGKSTALIGTADENLIWKFIRDVSSGLSYLHGLDIIHHDIKPDNILSGEDGTFLISDFGISTKMRSTLRRNSARSLNNDSIGGALPYMGPETFSDNPTAVKATDIWALGATLFEIVTGELPFFGQGGGMQLHGAAVPQINAPCSDELRDLISACLAKDTWDRPTAQQLAEYAQALIDGKSPTPVWKKTADVDVRKTVRRGTSSNISKSTVPQGQKTDDAAVVEESVSYGRHWFTTIVLWLMIAGNAMMFVLFCYLILTDWYIYTSAYRIGAVCAALSLCAGILMLKRSRWGFWLYIAANTVSIIAITMNSGLVLSIAAFAIGALILFGILCIRKNRSSVSAWKAMDYRMDGKRMRFAGVMALVLIITALSIPGAWQSASRKALDNYMARVKECRELIEQGSQSEPQTLINAKHILKTIVNDESNYSSVNKNFNESYALKQELDKKASEAAASWATAAEAQVRIGNKAKAKEFFDIAMQLDESSEMRSRYERAVK